jgi:hypothetical protein
MTALERIKEKIEVYILNISNVELPSCNDEVYDKGIKQGKINASKYFLSGIDLEIQKENQARDEMLNEEVLNDER